MAVDTVAIPAFMLGEHEITQAQFEAYADSAGLRLPSCFPQTRDDDPAGCITWNEAQAYIAWLNQQTGTVYRLPSEAEWEYVAGRVFHENTTFGLRNLFTGTAEWTADCWAPHFMSATSDGNPYIATNGCDSHAIRGGHDLDSPPPQNTTEALRWIRRRYGGRNQRRYSRIGFRLAKDLTASDGPDQHYFNGTYSGLPTDVQLLFTAHANTFDPPLVYGGLSESKRTTFESIMHALVTEEMLHLVEALTCIWGQRERVVTPCVQDEGPTTATGEGRGVNHFRISIELDGDPEARLLQNDTYERLEGNKCHVKLPNGEVRMQAACVKRRSDPTLHMSWLVGDDRNRGEIDIDYRDRDSGAHAQTENSDVRETEGRESHYRRHVCAFGEGLARWWRTPEEYVGGDTLPPTARTSWVAPADRCYERVSRN